MKSAIQTIDRAIKSINNIDLSYLAEEFLMRQIPKCKQLEVVKNAAQQGALFVECSQDAEEELTVGIYLHERVRNALDGFDSWIRPWSLDQRRAFAVACEEVSHFNYLLFHLNQGRPVSRLELELQGEVDSFIVSFYAHCGDTFDRVTFDTLFEQLFDRFHLEPSLNTDEKERYTQANRLARGLIQNWAHAKSENDNETAFLLLRNFYRAQMADKLNMTR